MDDRNLAGTQPLGEVLGTPIQARQTSDLTRCSALAQQGGKSHVAVHPPTRAISLQQTANPQPSLRDIVATVRDSSFGEADIKRVQRVEKSKRRTTITLSSTVL